MSKKTRYFTGILLFLLVWVFLGAAVSAAAPLYFPRVVCGNGWQTEIGVVNPVNDPAAVPGVLYAYDRNGAVLVSMSVSIPANGRAVFDVGSLAGLADPAKVAYCTFDDGDSGLVAYSEWCYEGILRASAPAVRDYNQGLMVAGHIRSNSIWRTEISLVNTGSAARTVNLSFDNGSRKELVLAGHAQFRGYLRDLFDGQVQPDINTLSIADAGALAGMLLNISFADNCSSIAAAVPLSSLKSEVIYFPHLACSSAAGGWYSNLVITNYAARDASCQCRIFNSAGKLVADQTVVIEPRTSYDSLTCDRGPGSCPLFAADGVIKAPEDNCWLSVKAGAYAALYGSESLIYAPGTGTEVIVNQMGSLNASVAGQTSGVFAKREINDGWSGFAFINPGLEVADLTLMAVDDQGMVRGIASISIDPYAKFAKTAADIFPDYDISQTSYIGYNSDQRVLAFQCNGSADGMMFDLLPGLAATFTVTDQDGDGYPAGVLDCDDTNPRVHVGCDIDDDGDGYSENQGDCDDLNAAIHPGAVEIYNDGIDQNCDGRDLPVAAECIGTWRGRRVYHERQEGSDKDLTTCSWADTLVLNEDYTFSDRLVSSSGTYMTTVCPSENVVGRWRLEGNIIHMEYYRDRYGYTFYRQLQMIDENHIKEDFSKTNKGTVLIFTADLEKP